MKSRPWHALDVAAVADQLGVDPGRGLSAAEAAKRLAAHGPNELREAPPEPAWRRLLSQFKELVIVVLIVAAVISGALGEWTDAIAIIVIVVLNGVVGFLQESRAGEALAALRRMGAPHARVLRDGIEAAIDARALVPGDVLALEPGDRVPADARLFEAFGLRVDEASLTGESVPAEKRAEAALPGATPLADRRNMIHRGAVVTAGAARAIAVGTGMETEIGRIAADLSGEKQDPTPLQRRLAELGRLLVILCLAIVAVVFCLELWRGGKLLDVFLLSVSLAVAAVPEGLPAIVTMVLALGLQRMARRGALVRRLPSVETLGCVTVICTDKTGTLTRNEMTVVRAILTERSVSFSGAGYAPEGDLFEGTDQRARLDPATISDLSLILRAGARCNHARLARRADGHGWEVLGDPTEGALLVAAGKAGVKLEEARVVFEIPFDSDRRTMSVVVEEGPLAGGHPPQHPPAAIMYTKGAPEAILRISTRERQGGADAPLDDARRAAVLATSEACAEEGLRVLALAMRPASGGAIEEERDLLFLGLVAMRDPPREEARDALRRCKDAGIRAIMITGDHPQTGLSIARDLGIALPESRAMSGAELDATPDADLARHLGSTPVFARVAAEHKKRIVRGLRSQGQVVAMTGDGVNDASAIRAADIGIAMGRSGTDVTREAADMVLTDDNFATIVNAVEEGRGIYDNIQKFVDYLLACNLGEIILVFVASLLGFPAPLFPVQLLWVNLVTDGLPALALGFEPPEPGIMSRPPRSPAASMISRALAVRLCLRGLLVGGVALAGFLWALRREATGVDGALASARTVAFCVIVHTELFFAFAARSERLTMPELGLFTNPALLGAVAISALLQAAVVVIPWARRPFATVGLGALEWGVVVGLSLVPMVIVEVGKLVRARRGIHAPALDAAPTDLREETGT